MRTRIGFLPLLALAFLASSLSCGGGGGGSSSPYIPPTATSLSYTDPASNNYQLVKSATVKSTSTHLVFDVVAPAGADLNGIGFELQVENGKAAWSPVEAGDPQLARNVAFTQDPSKMIFLTSVENGVLQVAIYQKSGLVAPVSTSAGTVLAQVGLDLTSKSLFSNSTISLTAVPGKVAVLNPPAAAGPTTPITLAIGRLAAE